jgi:hypothetical protein
MLKALSLGKEIVLSTQSYLSTQNPLNKISGIASKDYLNAFSTGRYWTVTHPALLEKTTLLHDAPSRSTAAASSSYEALTVLKNRLQIHGPYLQGEAIPHYGNRKMLHTHLICSKGSANATHYVVEWTYEESLYFPFKGFGLEVFEAFKKFIEKKKDQMQKRKKILTHHHDLYKKVESLTKETYMYSVFDEGEVELLKNILQEDRTYSELLSLQKTKMIAFLGTGSRENYQFRTEPLTKLERENLFNSPTAHDIYKKIDSSRSKIQYKIARINKNYCGSVCS